MHDYHAFLRPLGQTARRLDASPFRRHALRLLYKALGGAAVIAAAAQVVVRFAGTPVPFTLQSMAVLVVATLLGPRAGPTAVMTYLCLGAAGLPVFAGAGSGLGHLFGPTGGYLLSYLPVALWVSRANAQSVGQRVLSFAGAVVLTLIAGMAVLTPWVGLRTAWQVGCVAFLPVDLCKAAAAGLLVSALQRTPRR